MHFPHLRAITSVTHLLLLSPFANAAISVNGITNQSNYTGSQSFTVDDPEGFVTTASLNGTPIPVSTSVSADSAGFYELVIAETPEAGGKTVEETFLFNIREPGRGSTETGLPAFRAAPLVNDAASAINTGQLVIVTPQAYPDDLPVPVVSLLQKTDGDPLWLNSPVHIDGHHERTIQMRRGFGYTFLPAGSNRIDTSTASLNASNTVSIEDDTVPYTSVSGGITADIDFGDNARLDFASDMTVFPGVTVTIGAGSIVRVNPSADIHVDGSFIVNATPTNPTTFAPRVPGRPWGGFFLQEATSHVDITGAIFHGSGADQDWFDTNAGFSAHRDEQALFLVGPAGASLDLSDCYMIGNTGQLLHNDEGGDITITRCLLQGATTVGELTGGSITVDRSAMLLFPDENPDFADRDNDAIYLTTGQHSFTNTVIGYTQDDGIDTGSSPSGYTSNSSVESCWFESILHEAMANSGGKNCFATDSVFFNCGQTMECGYDGPHSIMLRCLSVANLVGARFGDNYNWNYNNNQFTVTDSLLLNNLYHDIWGYDWASWTYNTDQMTVTGTKMTILGDLAHHPGNSAFDPVADAGLISPYMPVPGSDVGIAIAGTPSQTTIDNYPGTFTVQLSTFSSNVVTAGYSLVAQSSLDGSESTLATGTLTFEPSETQKALDLPLPAGDYALVRFFLQSPTNAEDTGGEAWFLDPDTMQNPILIARGSDWNYSADRAEPTAGWRGQPYDHSTWKSGPTPIGFGDGDETTELTDTEAGPDDDRTIAVYFRKEFQIADPAAISALTLNLQRDDGAVVYLNGTEVARSNMDDGAVIYSTRASGSAGNSTEENAYHEINLPASALTNLQTGTNILAVEVHQSGSASSDLGFDLDLIAAQSDKTIKLLNLGGSYYIYWPNEDGVLQESEDLINWSITNTQSPYPIVTDDMRRFYRLIFR